MLSGWFIIQSLLLGCSSNYDKEEFDTTGTQTSTSTDDTVTDANDIDDDGDGFTENDGDCDDNNNTVYPGATETPNNDIDEDCDGVDASSDDPNDIDNDNDGFSENQGDCDDFNNTIYPGANDVPDNGIDEDCEGGDEISVSDNDVDNDNDGFTENQGDCDDNNNTIHPGATEILDNEIDENCDGLVEESVVEPSELSAADLNAGDLIVTEIMQNPEVVADADGEWFEIYNTTSDIINLNGISIGDDDGVDGNISTDLMIDPGEHLVLGNNADSNTNGGVNVAAEISSLNLANDDDEVIISYNGFPIDRVAYDGGPNFPDPAGKSISLDPDNYNASYNDNGTYWCYALSAQASGDFGTPGTMNDDCAASTVVDVDGDGYEADSAGGDDCNDNDATINPGAVDIAGNGIDEDCDGADAVATSNDADGDGYDSSDDCDDNDPSINPGMLDIGMDGIDQDCDGSDETGLCSDSCSYASWNGDGICDDGGPNASYSLCSFGSDCSDCGPRYDNDNDGYYDDEGVGALSSILELDCDDSDASINPGMLDIGMDNIDQDCDGADETGLCDDTCMDAGDGACDDGGPNASYNICGFGSDCTDCGVRYDNDNDGYYDDEDGTALDSSLVLDCDDEDATSYPGASEIANDGVDQDCDGADYVMSTEICDDSCSDASDGFCDDGGTDAVTSICDLGTDCSDCGSRYDDDGDGFDSGSDYDSDGVIDYTDDFSDCNDSEATINPDVTSDTCDGIDNNCDGTIDEDTDILEPNDADFPYYMGDLDANGDSVSVTSYMTHEGDEDAFTLYLFDNVQLLSDTDDFYCEFSPPAGLDISVEVFSPNGSSLGVADNGTAGQTEAVLYSSTYLFDDEGTYTFVISSNSGSSCSSISITCEKPN